MRNMIYGPALMMRGLTNSQINSGHAFLVYLVFQIKYARRNRNRNLAEEKKIPTICQVVDSVDESEDELNFVEYDCIGNLTEDENEELNEDYQVNSIEENSADNNGTLSESNLNNLAQNIDFISLEKKEVPSFTLSNIIKSSIFNIDKIKNYTSDNYTFDISIDGKLTNELEPKILDIEIPMTQINKNAECKFNIKEKQAANLNCTVNVEEYKQYSNFSFKVIDIDDDGSPIYLSRINEIYLFNKAKSKKEKEKNNKILIVIIPIVIGVIIVLGVLIVVRFRLRAIKSHKETKQEINAINLNIDAHSVNTQRGLKNEKS